MTSHVRRCLQANVVLCVSKFGDFVEPLQVCRTIPFNMLFFFKQYKKIVAYQTDDFCGLVKLHCRVIGFGRIKQPVIEKNFTAKYVVVFCTASHNCVFFKTVPHKKCFWRHA